MSDVVLGINGYRLNNDLKSWCRYYRGQAVVLDVRSANKVRQVTMAPTMQPCYQKYRIERIPNPTVAQVEAWDAWAN